MSVRGRPSEASDLAEVAAVGFGVSIAEIALF